MHAFWGKIHNTLIGRSNNWVNVRCAYRFGEYRNRQADATTFNQLNDFVGNFVFVSVTKIYRHDTEKCNITQKPRRRSIRRRMACRRWWKGNCIHTWNVFHISEFRICASAEQNISHSERRACGTLSSVWEDNSEHLLNVCTYHCRIAPVVCLPGTDHKKLHLDSVFRQ